MNKGFLKYFLSLSILIIGVCGQLSASSSYSADAAINVGRHTEGRTTAIEDQQYIPSGFTSSSSEKRHTSKIEVTDEQEEEEEENEPILSKEQLQDYNSLSLFNRFYKTGYLFHLIKNQFTFYKHFTYLSTYKTLHLMFSVLQL